MLTFQEFSDANRERLAAFQGGHTAEELALCVAEECGEIAGAMLGAIGAKKRKAHLTSQDVVDECADLMTYLDLLIQKLGYNTSDVLVSKFNRVSERAGSNVRLRDWRAYWESSPDAERSATD